MSTDCTDSRWQQVADAFDEVEKLIDAIPCGFDGYELAAESEEGLRQAGALLQRAAELLLPVLERECPRYEAWAVMHTQLLNVRTERAS